MKPQTLAKSYHTFLPVIRRLPSYLQIQIASVGRKFFLNQFYLHQSKRNYTPPPEALTTLWDIKFRSPLGNSAGMFKNGEAYDLMAQIGAGFYLGGTSTANPRIGNRKKYITHPFINLPNSGLVLNFMGLPNLGDEKLSSLTITKHKLPDCPIGWSVMRSPDFPEERALERLVTSIHAYCNHPQIDFIEINESCPNIATSGGNLLPRIDYLGKQLQPLKSPKPLIIKLSCDINEAVLESLTTRLIELGFAGITLGNTSTDYALYRQLLTKSEQTVFDYFTTTFGGGISGKFLNSRSLSLGAIAANVKAGLNPNHEFHIIRSGGVSCLHDINAAQQHGISLSQWFSGFFDSYSNSGDNVYHDFWENNES